MSLQLHRTRGRERCRRWRRTWSSFSRLGVSVVLGLLLAPATLRAELLQPVGSLRDSGGPYGLLGAHGIDVSPDGQSLYVASFVDDSLVVLERDPPAGSIAYVERHVNRVAGVDGLMSATAVAVSPDAADVYVVGYFADAMATFRRDRATGQLGFHQVFHNEDVAGLSSPRSLSLSPDGSFVYVATYYDDSLVVFRRDAANGRLTHIQTLTNTVDGVRGLLRNAAVAVSPDAANVYVASEGGDAVAVFARAVGAEQLSFVEAKVDGEEAIRDLTGPTSIVVSPDGRYVYALAKWALLTFRRDLFNGRLELLSSSRVGIATGEADPATTSLTLNHDGTLAFVTLSEEDSVVVFSRSVQSGRLGLRERLRNGLAGVDGIAGAHDVAVSPDDRFVYVAAQFDDAVTTFAVGANTCPNDCNQDGMLSVDELVHVVAAAAGTVQPACASLDIGSNGAEAANKITLALDFGLYGCP